MHDEVPWKRAGDDRARREKAEVDHGAAEGEAADASPRALPPPHARDESDESCQGESVRRKKARDERDNLWRNLRCEVSAQEQHPPDGQIHGKRGEDQSCKPVGEVPHAATPCSAYETLAPIQ